jgi:GDP-D-mannose dehydratase
VLEQGNLDAKRGWGFAEELRGRHMVHVTNRTKNVRDFVTRQIRWQASIWSGKALLKVKSIWTATQRKDGDDYR